MIERTVQLTGGSYRNKLTGEVVQAICWQKDGDHPQVVRYPIEGRDAKGLLELGPKEKFNLAFGDWIVEDAEGRALYVVDGAKFAAQYEPHSETEAA